MNDKNNSGKECIKRETLWLSVLAALCIGFASGFAYGVYKSSAPIHGVAGLKPQGSQLKNVEAMIKTALEETQRYPENADTWIQLGNLYYDNRQPEKAIPAYQQALELTPDNADVWSDLGVMFRQSGQPEKAIEAFDKAFALDQQHQTALYNKGVVLMHDLNEEQLAADAWKSLININPQARTPSGVFIRDMIASIENKDQAD